jgi:chaperone modulatory protein CbpM
MTHPIEILNAETLDDLSELSLVELCLFCGGTNETRKTLQQLVFEGVLNPSGHCPEDWRFHSRDLYRARRALRLARDLELNLAGAALALELLEEIDRLRNRLRVLEQRFP